MCTCILFRSEMTCSARSIFESRACATFENQNGAREFPGLVEVGGVFGINRDVKSCSEI